MMYPYPGYCGTGLTELTEVPGTGIKVLQSLQNFRVLWHRRTELPEVPDMYKNAVPVPRVFVAPAYRTSRSSGHGHECPTEVIELLCRVIPGVNTPGMILRVFYKTKIKSSGTGTNVQNSQTFRVREVLYITHKPRIRVLQKFE